jgi:HAD superfamily hydrolase (TIGR01509 family)
MAVVTSSDRTKMQSLYSQHPEFPGLFDQIVTGDMVTHAKPDPDCFLMGAKLIGVNIKDCIVFEDSRNGLIAGRNSGAKVIGIPTTLSYEQVSELSDLTINAVSELSIEEILNF